MSGNIYFKADRILYFIPEINPGEEKLRNIFYRNASKNIWNVSNVMDSFWARLLYRRRLNGKTRKLFERIRKVEGRGSKMAFKILTTHPHDPVIIMGVDGKTGTYFEAKYAETEMQRIMLSRSYEALTKLQNTPIVPKVLQYESRPDCLFIKTELPDGEKLFEKEINKDIINYLVNLTQYSVNQFKEENSLGLITSISNGSFAPWNVIKDLNGKYHMLQWQHVADRPLGYDLTYYLMKPYLEHDEMVTDENLAEYGKWLENFYSLFGIEDYSIYLDTNIHIYATQLESDGRYVEANRVRMIGRAALNHFYNRTGNGDHKLLTRPKIFFIMHMPPPIHGAAMIGKYIHESEYVNSKFDCYYLNLTFASSLEDVGVVSIAKTLRLFKLIGTIKSQVKRIKPDLVYITPNATGVPFFKDSVVVNTVKSTGYPVLAHFHNKGVSTKENGAIYKRCYRRFFDQLKVLLIVPSLYDDNKTFLRIRDLYICANGTPDTLESEIKAERHNEVPEILFLSHMIISKGVLDLLDALYLLRGQGQKFHCTMIGAETAELSHKSIEEEINSRHLGNYVDYIGPRYGAEKDEYLQKTDIMVFPTYYPKECLPLVILEAMEYKIPIVSTREAGIPYAVIDGETGYLCKSQNPIDLSEKIEKLLENPELRWKMGEEGYKLRKKKYSLDTFEMNFANVLERTINDIHNKE